MPVAFALWPPASSFIANLRGVSAGFTTLGKSMYRDGPAVYAWSPLMFFMLMGYLASTPGSGRTIYGCAQAQHALAPLRGGLAVGSEPPCALFGAVRR